MQKYMSCKGACLASIGADQPAEVVDDAPRHLVCLLACAFVFLLSTPVLWNLSYWSSGWFMKIKL